MDALLKAKSVKAKPVAVEPDLKLLFELEPAHEVFVRNLTDTLYRRTVSPVVTATKPAAFWSDVFVESRLPWKAFSESILWHLVVVSVLWTVAQTWAKQEQIQQRRNAEHSQLTYYAPPKTFPALGGKGPQPQQQVKPRAEAKPSPLKVAAERANSANKPPELKLQGKRPDFVASSATPLFAPHLPHAKVPAAPGLAVGPSAKLGAATSRRFNSPEISAVAPTAKLGALSSRSGIPFQNSAAVAPPPALKGSAGKRSASEMGMTAVVAPAPSLSANDRNGIFGKSAPTALRSTIALPIAPSNGPGMMGTGRQASRIEQAAIAPTPAGSGGGGSAAGRRNVSLGPESQGIAPSPSLRGAGNISGRGRASSLSGGGTQAVPPPASIGSGNMDGMNRGGSLTGTGTNVVPPSASLEGPASSGVVGGRGTSLSGTDAGVVPPVASSRGSGDSSGRQGSLLSDAGQQALPPAAEIGNTANPRPSSSNAIDAKAVPPAPTIDQKSDPATIELPVRVIGLALSLPNSSYFSNYEVFIAERRQKKGEAELIKLVYESLPYQPRLAEYGLDNSKVYKLRVKRDPTCDETLLNMTWPQTDETHSGSKYATGPPALAPGEKNNLLPCYRTTADDYRRAVTR
jgi:hypothetical protein